MKPARRVFTNPKRGYDSGPPCVVCGYFRINVRHELDPEHSAEGIDYFRENDLIGNLHEFVALTPAVPEASVTGGTE